MAVFEVQLTESTRQNFALILTIIHVFGALFSLCLVGIGTYIKVAIEEKISLTDDYNNDVLPWMMISIGLMNMFICMFGMFLCIQARDLEKRVSLRPANLPYVCISFFISICVFASAMMSFAHVNHLHHSFGNGLLEGMKQYKSDAVLKEDIDVLQMEYECCGAHDYTDWFKISWIANEYLDLDSKTVQGRMVHGEYYNDDVPFSCCDPSAMRPCIHHHVTRDHAHFSYSHEEQVTIYTTGCREALMEYFSEILYESSIVVVVIFCIQLVITLSFRFLQTSIGEAIDRGDPEYQAPGWLFGSLKPTDDYDHVPLSPAGGDFDSDSSHALYETPPQPRRSTSHNSRRGSRLTKPKSLSHEYQNLAPRSGHVRRYDTNTEEQTE